MAVYAVAAEKGGVGKTTIAVQLAIMLAQLGRDVLLVDADVQKSALEVAAVRAEEGHQPAITAISLTGRSVPSELRKLKKKYEDIVIDVGGRDTFTLRAALVSSDHIILPMLPGQLDAWTLDNFDDMMQQVIAFNPPAKAYLVMNKVDTNPNVHLADEVQDFATDLENIKPLKTRLGYRVAYRRCVAEGQAVNEMGKRDLKAMNEMDSLLREVLGDEYNTLKSGTK